MPNPLLAHEPLIRLSVFAGVLSGVAIWEALRPRRERIFSSQPDQ